MLLTLKNPDVYMADSLDDISQNYKELEGNLVLICGDELYAVSSKDGDGKGMLIRVPGAAKYFDEIKTSAELYGQ